jgi:hypothetical protein
MTRTNYGILLGDMFVEESIEGNYTNPRDIEEAMEYPSGSVTITGITPTPGYYVAYIEDNKLGLFRGSYDQCVSFIEDIIEANTMIYAISNVSTKILQDYVPQEF